MASQAETLREKAFRLMNEYEALGLRPGGEPAYAEGVDAYQRLLADHPGDAELNREYGYLQECHGRNLIRAAAARYERAIELDPSSDKPHYQLIFARSALHESDRVIDLYKKRLAASPDQIREYRFLAEAYLRGGALDEAGKVIAAGRKLEPDDDALLAAEAEVLDASGRREEALAAWRTLKQRDPEDLSPYFMSAFTLEGLGRYREAAAEWRYIIGWLEAHGMAVHSNIRTSILESVRVIASPVPRNLDFRGGVERAARGRHC